MEGGAAVLVALLLVASTVTPVVAAGGPGEAGASAADGRLVTDGTAAELTHRAATEVREANLPQSDRALSRLNDSLASFLDADRVTDGAAFDAHRKVAATFQNRVEDVPVLLASADHALANTSIVDAERVRETLLARNVSFDESAVEDDLASARRSFEKGRDLQDRGNYVGAISHYRTAWTAAQRALDRMDAAVDPSVTISTRVDPPHNDTITYVLEGEVFDVRTHQVAEVTVSTDDVTTTVPLNVSTEPGTADGFTARINLSDRVNEVTVTATDPGDPVAGSGGADTGESKGKKGKTKGDGKDSGADADADPATGSATLKLDGDGLPDRYETGVLGMDPLDPDSDSGLTDADEADDGTLDGLEDLDGDLVNYHEYRFGTDPLVEDTDGDGLTDAFEARVPSLDPLAADTNDDGIGDGEDDPDEDGLSTLREQAEGTDPFEPDTDGEGLDDGAEVDEYDTNATRPDTDGDGLDDAEEVDLGTDPLTADSDGDGTPDANETFTTETASASLGATVEVTGEGNVAGSVDVSEPRSVALSPEYAPNATVSEFVSFETNRSFESAEITLSYDEGAVPTNESNVAVYRFDPENGSFEKLDSRVDAANDTVTTTTSHFSTYVAFDERAWNEYLDTVTRFGAPDDLPAADADFVNVQSVDPTDYTDVSVYASVDTEAGRNGELTKEDFRVFEAKHEMPIQSVEFTEGTAVDIVFVFDDTGSMYGEIASMKRNSREFVDGIEDAGLDARYALVSYKDYNHVDQTFTGDAGEFRDAIDGLYAWGGGDWPEDSLDAIYTGTRMEFREDAQKVVVHITDAASHADWRTSHTVDDVEREMRRKGIGYYTVSPSGTKTVEIADRVGGLWIDIASIRGLSTATADAENVTEGPNGTRMVRNNSVGPAREKADDGSTTDDVSTAAESGTADSFDAFLEDVRSRLTNRYKITYASCLPKTETGRQVDVFASSDGQLGSATDGYSPPADAPRSYPESCDPDGDDIPTYLEEDGIPLFPTLTTVETDPNDPDTDGDGTPDDVEVDVDNPVVLFGTFLGYPWQSNPAEENTDGVGLNDTEELTKANPSDPKVAEVLWVSLSVPTLTRDMNDDGEPDPVPVSKAGDPDASNDPICAWDPDYDDLSLTCQGGNTDQTLATSYQDDWSSSFGCPGPLCFGDGPPGWIPEDAKSGKIYFLLRSSVQSKAKNVDTDGLEYTVHRQDGRAPRRATQMTFMHGPNMEGPVDEEGRELNFVYRLPKDDPGSLGQLSYRDLGTFSVEVEGLDGTDLSRPGGDGTARSEGYRYAGYTDPAFVVSKSLVEDARQVFEKGMEIYSLTQTGLVTFRATGSLAAAGKDVVKSYLWSKAKGEILPFPTSPEGATAKAMAIFEQDIEEYRTNGPKRDYVHGDVSYVQIVVIRAS